jgi:hypothetical protein
MEVLVLAYGRAQGSHFWGSRSSMASNPVLTCCGLLPAAGPAEDVCLAEYRNLRPGPPERAGDSGQPVRQRAACGLRAVLPAYLHGEWAPVLQIGSAVFPRSCCDLGLQYSVYSLGSDFGSFTDGFSSYSFYQPCFNFM